MEAAFIDQDIKLFLSIPMTITINCSKNYLHFNSTTVNTLKLGLMIAKSE